MFPLKITRTSAVRSAALAAGIAALAACATPPPPPPPPPPPVVIPPMPLPPLGAAAGMTIPAMDEFGVRRTANYRLTTPQTTWHLRSALNVAALNCLDPQHGQILPAYKLLLDRHKTKLADTNKELTTAFRQIYGGTYRDTMDDYLTQVYNYFALPPVQKAFCDVAQDIAIESMAIQPDQLDAFAARSMPRIEAVFEDFFKAYEAYLEELAKWNKLYGTPRVIVYSAPPPFSNPLRPEFDYRPPVTADAAPAVTLPGEAAPATTSITTYAAPPSSAQQAPVVQLPAETLPGASVPVEGPVVQAESAIDLAPPPSDEPAAQPTAGPIYGPQADPDDGSE